MKGRDRVWIFTELFYPDQTSTGYIMTELAKHLSENAIINVVTEAPGIGYGLTGSESREALPDENLKVYRFRGSSLNKNHLFQRILKLVRTSVRFCAKFLTSVRKGETVVLVTNPALFLLFTAYLNFIKKARLVLIVHDVFPENILAAGMSGKGIVFRIFKKIFDGAYMRFHAIIVLGRDMNEIVATKINKRKTAPEVFIIENWADTVSIYPAATRIYNQFPETSLNFLFAGNVGRVQSLDAIISVIGPLSGRLSLTIIGSGSEKKRLEGLCRHNSFSNILFIEPQPRERQIDFLNSFDASVVSLSQNMYGLGVPSKTYNILATGKPILYFGPKGSEIDRLVKEYPIGWSCNDAEELDSTLQGLSKADIEQFDQSEIRELAERVFSKDVILEKFSKVILCQPNSF